MQNRQSARPGSRWLGPAVALSFGLLAALPLWFGPGFLNTRGGGDSPFLLFRLHQLTTALADGVFPVRWMPDAAFGLGYPFFSYYAALPYYFAAVFALFGLSYVQSIVLVQTLGSLLAAWAVYGWLNQSGASRPAAWLGTAAYAFAPFHLVNVYVRGDSLSEFWAFAWFPLILLAALRLARRPSLRRMLPLAVSYAALLLTHNISALIFTPFVGAYVVVILFSGNWLLVTGNSSTKSQSPFWFLLYTAIALGLGLALSAFFWLPALLEGGYGQLGTVTQGYFNYTQHFRGFNLIQPSLLFNYDVGSQPGDSTPFAMGLVQALLVAAGLAGLAIRLVRGRLSAHDLFGLIGLAGATFMVTPLSRPLWDTLPLLPFVQFPWRFLSVQSLFAALVISRAVAPWEGAPATEPAAPPLLRLPSLLGLGLSAALALTSLASLRLDFVPLGDGDVTAQRLQLYEYFTGNLGTTIRNEYLPRWSVPRPYSSDELLLRPVRVKALLGEVTGERLAKSADRQEWQIAVDTRQALVAVPLNYWPGWTAQVDGVDVPVSAAPGLGWVTFVAPQGEHSVSLQLKRTPLRGFAEALSLFAVLALAVLGLRSLSRSAFSLGRLAWGVGTIVAVLALAGAAAALPNPAASIVRLTADFDQLAYFNSGPVRFAGGGALAGYDYSADRLARGQTLEVTSLWQDFPAEGDAPWRVTLELSPPPAPVRSPLPTVYASTEFEAAPLAVAQIRIPTDIAPGVYLLRLRVEAGGEPVPALTSSGQPRGTVYLRPIWVDDPGPDTANESLAADFGPAVRLMGLGGTQSSLDAVDVHLAWQAVRDVPQNYALALRLNDRDGTEWAALDTQPGQGFYPSGMWRPGEIVLDRLPLAIPIGAAPGEYSLKVTLYEAASLRPLGQAVQTVTLEVPAPAPAGQDLARLTDALRLAQVEAPAALVQGEPLNLTAHWVTRANLPEGLQARWTLTPEAGGETFEATAPLSTAADPQDWPSDALILGRASLQLPPDLTPGTYHLGLVVLNKDGEAAGRAADLAVVQVQERERLSALPAGARRLKASFGEALGLAGYELDREPDAITLTPYWSATGQPGRSYKYFVHLFDPATEDIATQADGFPRDGAYPTTQWAEGEVVADTIRLSLAGVPPGAYRLALGWYDPEAPEDRLPAKDADGQALDQNRVVLPDEIIVR